MTPEYFKNIESEKIESKTCCNNPKIKKINNYSLFVPHENLFSIFVLIKQFEFVLYYLNSSHKQVFKVI